MILDKIDFHEFIESITDMLEMKDIYTRGHSNRVAVYAEMTALKMGCCKEVLYRIHIAGHLHDIGKVAVRDAVLNKEGKLTIDEYEEIKQHSENGYNILSKVKGMEKLAQIVRGHHERWDGNGYPDKLNGKIIPIESRIIAICDTFDAITSNRVYRKKMTIDDALKIIDIEKWKQFDGDIAGKFIEMIKENRNEIQKIVEN